MNESVFNLTASFYSPTLAKVPHFNSHELDTSSYVSAHLLPREVTCLWLLKHPQATTANDDDDDMAASGGFDPGDQSSAADDGRDDKIRAAIANGRNLMGRGQFDEAGRVIREVGSRRHPHLVQTTANHSTRPSTCARAIRTSAKRQATKKTRHATSRNASPPSRATIPMRLTRWPGVLVLVDTLGRPAPTRCTPWPLMPTQNASRRRSVILEPSQPPWPLSAWTLPLLS